MALTSKQEDPNQELDLDLMRAIQLSLDQQTFSTSENKEQSSSKRHSSSSSSSSSFDEAQGHSRGGDEQFIPDETSLQRALELSYGDLVKGKL